MAGMEGVLGVQTMFKVSETAEVELRCGQV